MPTIGKEKNIMLRKKIQQQINDIRDELLFFAYQNEGHAIEKHVLSDDELRRALWVKPRPKYDDDIVMVTRFSSKSRALNIIADTLQENIDAIEKWLLTDSEADLAVTATFEDATGDGLAKNTNWTKTIPVHAAMVVLRKNFALISRSFIVVTAYPIRNFDDNDIIYEAIDEFISKKNR